MNNSIRRIVVLLCLLGAATVACGADDAPPTTQPASKDVIYKPREGRGAPKNKAGGGTRGKDDKLPGDAFVFFVLAPDEVVEKAAAEVPVAPLTVSAHPQLFWYISKLTEEKFA